MSARRFVTAAILASVIGVIILGDRDGDGDKGAVIFEGYDPL